MLAANDDGEEENIGTASSIPLLIYLFSTDFNFYLSQIIVKNNNATTIVEYEYDDNATESPSSSSLRYDALAARLEYESQLPIRQSSLFWHHFDAYTWQSSPYSIAENSVCRPPLSSLRLRIITYTTTPDIRILHNNNMVCHVSKNRWGGELP